MLTRSEIATGFTSMPPRICLLASCVIIALLANRGESQFRPRAPFLSDPQLEQGYYSFIKAEDYEHPPKVRKPPYHRANFRCSERLVDGKLSPRDTLCGDLNKGVIPMNPIGQRPINDPYPLAISRDNVNLVAVSLDYWMRQSSPIMGESVNRCQERQSFLTQILVGCIMSKPCSAKTKAMAKLLLNYGASLTEEVNGGTVLEWAVRFVERDWVGYLLGEGAVACSRSGQGKNALRLAAILGYKNLFKMILNHPSVPRSCRREAGKLWKAASVIVRNEYCAPFRSVDGWNVLQFSLNEAELQRGTPLPPVSVNTIPTNNRRTIERILQNVTFVRAAFGGRLPPFFAHRLLLASLENSRLLTVDETVDLLSVFMDCVGESAFRFNSHLMQHRISKRYNDVYLPRVSDLLVKYCRGQFLCTEPQKSYSGFPKIAKTLLGLVLTTPSFFGTPTNRDITCLTEAVSSLESALHLAAVLAVAIDLWRSPDHDNPANLEAFIRCLINRGAYVGISGMFLNDDTPLSAMGLPVLRADAIGKMVFEAACCQLNYADDSIEDPPEHWRLPSLMCLAARRLNRYLDVQQFDDLPDVLINTRRMLIPLPYLVDSHNAGYLRSQRLRSRRGPPFPSITLGRVQLLDTELDYFGYF